MLTNQIAYENIPLYKQLTLLMKALPSFSVFFLVTDIVFCAIRIIMVLLALFGMSSMTSNDPLYLSGFFEIITGIGIVFFGFE